MREMAVLSDYATGDDELSFHILKSIAQHHLEVFL